MRGINRVFIVGHLGHDPELRTTRTGTPVCRLRIATNRSRKNGDQWIEETDWHSVQLWDQRAEVAQRYLVKGSPVCIEGRLKSESWTDEKSGEKRYSTTIVADALHLLGRPPAGLEGGQGSSRTEVPVVVAEEEIPF